MQNVIIARSREKSQIFQPKSFQNINVSFDHVYKLYICYESAQKIGTFWLNVFVKHKSTG